MKVMVGLASMMVYVRWKDTIYVSEKKKVAISALKAGNTSLQGSLSRRSLVNFQNLYNMTSGLSKIGRCGIIYQHLFFSGG